MPRGFFPEKIYSLLLFAALLAGCGRPGPDVSSPSSEKPLTKVTLQTDWYAQPEHGGFYQAVAKGFYREAGLDVQILQGGPNALPMQKAMIGQVDFAIGRSDDAMVAAGHGLPMYIVAALMERDPQAIMFHQASGIHSFRDLDKRTIMAVPGSGFIPIMERKYGIKVSVTPLDFGLSRFLADPQFVQQCFITNEPFYVRQKGADVETLLLSDTGFSPYRIWFTSRKYAAQHPDVVRAFTVASIRGWRDYMEGDRSAADRRIGELNKQMTPEFIAYSVGAMKQYHLVAGDAAAGETYGQIRVARLQQQLEQLQSIGVIEHPLRVADVFDGKFIPAEAR